MNKIIGRLKEIDILSEILKSQNAEFLAVYDRKRVGKTYLIRNFFTQSNCCFFYVSGIQNATLKEQLETFTRQIGDSFYKAVYGGKIKN